MIREVYKAGEMEALRPYVGDALFERLHGRRHLAAALPDGGLLLLFHVCELAGQRRHVRQVCLYASAARIVLVTDDARCVRLMQAAEDGTPARVLHRFFAGLTDEDIEPLERMEGAVTALEDAIVTAGKPVGGIGERIVSLRRSLLALKRYYEQLSLITEALAEDTAGLFGEEERRLFVALDRHVDRLLDYVLHLREYVTQVREAYQAQLDYEQNQLMRTFTVMTAIFFPLSLIVGWYGMNFSMPEYGWAFGYPMVIAPSVVVCGICFRIFRRKKWL